MSQFIESIKVEDQKVFLLDLHQQRVRETFAHFGKECSIDLEKIFKDLEHDEDGLYKLRIGKFQIPNAPLRISRNRNF